MTTRDDFLKALKADPDCTETRLRYVDWLLEHEEYEEAERQRAWEASRAWLVGFAKSINYDNYERDAAGDYVEDERGELVPVPGGPALDNPHSYADVLEAGYAAVGGRGYCFGTDAGADFFRSNDDNCREFFGHWSVVTGVAVPADVIADPPFRCAC